MTNIPLLPFVEKYFKKLTTSMFISCFVHSNKVGKKEGIVGLIPKSYY